MVACGAPSAKPGREERFFLGKSAGNVKKSIYSENVLRYSENALAKIRAR
jgi:uracil-DNA glycosylase